MAEDAKSELVSEALISKSNKYSNGDNKMSSQFSNYKEDPRIQKQLLTNKYSAARLNLLLFIIFSAVNIILLAVGANTYFLFSASIPYIIVKTGMFACGLLPPEYYGESFAEMHFSDKSFFAVSIVIAFLVLGIYLLCWIFSRKNNVRCLSIGLVLVVFDTIMLILNSGLGAIVDLLFHIWIIVIIAMGISAHNKLRRLPKEEEIIEGEFSEVYDEIPDEATHVEGENSTEE